MTMEEAEKILRAHHQEHVLRFRNQLNENQRAALLNQINELDFDALDRMREMLLNNSTAPEPPAIEPAPVVKLNAAEHRQATAQGEELLRKNRVGVILVAGGQGTRLGFDGPKGAFPIGPISRDPLFAIHAGKIVALERRFSAQIPFYIMTSETNDAATRAFFAEHNWFGLSSERVFFFRQGMWPALDEQGRVILDRPDHIFMSPDGHGGLLRAMRVNGILNDMRSRKLQAVFYFQVDNPLVEIADPAFIGIHIQQRSQMSVKVCAKRDPDEGLGVVVLRRGHNAIVEYTELTNEQKHARLPDGNLVFRYGSVAIHVFDPNFLTAEAERNLPLHIARKKVPFCNEAGEIVQPDQPNACKFEKFIFDALPDAERSLNMVFERANEFSPVKNREGSDSPATAQRDMMRKYARMLRAAGFTCPLDSNGNPTVKIEIRPEFALTPEDLAAQLPADFKIEKDTLL